MTFVQGFSDNLYAWFRDENGSPRTSRSATGSPPINSNGSVSIFFVFPCMYAIVIMLLEKVLSEQ